MALEVPTRQDVEPGEYYVPEEGYYELVFTKYDEPVQSNFKDKRTNDYGQRICLYFEVDEEGEEAHGYEFRTWWNFDMNAELGSSMYHPLKALCGGEEPNRKRLDDYLRLRCGGTVKHVKKPSKNDPTRTVTFANIDALSPLKKKRRAAPPPDDEPEEEAEPAPKKSAFEVDDEDE